MVAQKSVRHAKHGVNLGGESPLLAVEVGRANLGKRALREESPTSSRLGGSTGGLKNHQDSGATFVCKIP